MYIDDVNTGVEFKMSYTSRARWRDSVNTSPTITISTPVKKTSKGKGNLGYKR